tara:strand:- start:111 stop:575 length:465 start_codon:yes stop_codon:yes gene_type:complete
MENLYVRFANESDCKNIFEWRNDKYTRQMSYSNEVVKWKHHVNWFTKSLISENRILVITEKSHEGKVALVYFDIKKSEAIISINLNPIFRGKGLAKSCLFKSIEYFLKNYVFIKVLAAEIRQENISSIKIFSSIGFKKINVENGIEFYKKNINE